MNPDCLWHFSLAHTRLVHSIEQESRQIASPLPKGNRIMSNLLKCKAAEFFYLGIDYLFAFRVEMIRHEF